jgi:hypothetical protein
LIYGKIDLILIIFALSPGVLKGASGFLELHQVCIICPAKLPQKHSAHSNGGQERSLAIDEKLTDLAAE